MACDWTEVRFGSTHTLRPRKTIAHYDYVVVGDKIRWLCARHSGPTTVRAKRQRRAAAAAARLSTQS